VPLWAAVTGALPGWLVAVWPVLGAVSVAPAAVGLFLAGALALWLVALLAVLVSLRLRRS